MEIINICFVIHEYSGAYTYAKELFSYLQPKEYIKFHIIYFGNFKYKQFTVAEKKGNYVFYIPFQHKGNIPLLSRRVVQLLSPWLKNQTNLILHLNNPNQHYLGQYMKETYQAKIVYTLHFLMNYFTIRAMESTIPQVLDRSGNKEMIQLADQVITVTHFASQVVSSYYAKEEKNIKLIYNGYGSPEAITPISPEKKILWKEKSGFYPDDSLLLYAGRIDATKGCDKLLIAMNELVKKYPRLHLIVAGDGHFKEHLKQVGLNCAKIHFTGYLTANQLLQLYQIVDLGIIPSLWEQCSYVALEMIAHGLPVIYSDVPGLQELFQDNVTGKAIPCVCAESKYGLNINPQDIEKAVATLQDSPLTRACLGNNARKKWAQAYTAAIMGQQTLNVYHSLL